MIEIREISDPLYKATVASWETSMPAWWLAGDRGIAEHRTSGPVVAVGTFNDDELVAVFYLQQTGVAQVEAHISCPKGTNPRILEEAGKVLKRRIFAQGFKRILVETMSLNRGLMQLVKTWGFTPTGVTLNAGYLGSRPIRWIQLEALPDVE